MAQNILSGAVVSPKDQFKIPLFNILVSDGATTATLDLVIARNALVDELDLVVEAAQATSTLVKNVAQLRVNPAPPTGLGNDAHSVVIDFGVLRTVSAVECSPVGQSIVRVYPWTGSAFSFSSVYSATFDTGTGLVGPESGSFSYLANFRSEVRTERLKVDMVGAIDEETLPGILKVVLPEAPSGLELKINGAAAFWTHPAAVTSGSEAALTFDSWNSDSKRLISAAAAVAPLVGDPNSREMLSLQFVLTTRAPGKLSLGLHHQEKRFTRRLLFGSDTSHDVEFEVEGSSLIPVVTDPPDSTHSRDVREMHLTMVGTFPPERALPPLGPENAGRADLVLTPDRAALVRIMPGSHDPGYAGTSFPFGSLEEITAIRLPLAAASEGAEVRVSLWSNREPAEGEPLVDEPVEVLPDASSRPVVLQGSDEEQWITFEFDQPVPFEAANAPWAALLVSRGSVAWALGESSSSSDVIDPCVLRTGPPSGPWQNLPAPLANGQPGIGSSRGRLRLVGHAAKDEPIAPFLLSLSGSAGSFEATPSEKGTALLLTVEPPVVESGSALEVISRVSGSLTLRDIDVISAT